MQYPFVFLVLVSACTELPETVHFESSSGTGAALRDCVCAYYDGTDDDFSLQFTCTSGNDTIGSISLFADPRNTNGDGDARLIYIPTHVPANYAGSGLATIDPVGPIRDPSTLKAIRDVSNISFHWAEQDDCNVAQPCDIDSFHLAAGSVGGGHGGCEDYYVSQANDLR